MYSENGFSIGFVVAKKFSWVKTKKHNPLKEKLEQPCILLYTTLNSKLMEDIDYDGTLQNEFGSDLRFCGDNLFN